MNDRLQQMIDALKEMSGAPRHRWPEKAREIQAITHILTADGGIQAVNIASAGKILAPTFAHCCEQNEQECRGVLRALAVMLENERAALGDAARPYHLRGDR